MNIHEGAHEQIITAVTNWLREKSSRPTLLLASGGSSARVLAKAWQQLTPTEQGAFTVSLADERFGPAGHADSNWTLLLSLGIDLSDPRHIPVLHNEPTMAEAATNWQAALLPHFQSEQQIITVLGMGDDSHIAGIKPGSPAVTATDLVVSYPWEDYQRITLSAPALTRINSTVVYVTGATKHAALVSLANSEADPATQPSQLLKTMQDCNILYEPEQPATQPEAFDPTPTPVPATPEQTPQGAPSTTLTEQPNPQISAPTTIEPIVPAAPTPTSIPVTDGTAPTETPQSTPVEQVAEPTTTPTTAKPVKSDLPPTALTIFGVTGNLSQIKLLPALYHLLKKDMLPDNFVVVGVFRATSIDLDHLMQQVEINLLRKHQEADRQILDRLRNLIRPITMDSTNVDDYHALRQKLDELDAEGNTKYQRLYYLAIPPNIFQQVIGCLNQAGLHDETQGAARRILVEKPFGTNLQTARELVQTMSSTFQEHQIYRIDHYLAKENAQNILTFRFNNPIIQDMWGRQSIDHIQITATEKIGIDKRSSFYEGMGALRDFIQSHLLQLMALTMMEAPAEMTSQLIHKEKLALLNAVQPIKPNHVDERSVRGQYATYRDEVNNQTSNVETYAAVSLDVANSRWGGVPVLIRTGKSLDQARTEINVVFKDRTNRNIPANVLTIRIQPSEGIDIRMTAKKPGFGDELQPVTMHFDYQGSFDSDSPDAYERVLVDTIAGDQSLFASSEEVVRCWEILESVLDYWQSGASSPEIYEAGSTGPAGADTLAASVGSEWL